MSLGDGFRDSKGVFGRDLPSRAANEDIIHFVFAITPPVK